MLTTEQRKKLEEMSDDCLHKGGSKRSFLLGVEAGHAIRDGEVRELEAKVNQLTYELDKSRDSHVRKIRELQSEVERLRKANEAMRAALDECRDYMVRPEDTRGVAYFPAREALAEADKILGCEK